MRRFSSLFGACVLSLSLAACGGGTSDNTLATGTGGGSTGNARPSTPPVDPVPTPGVPRQDGTATGMSDRELAFASDLFEILNGYRTNNGRSALQWEAPITAVAQGHTRYQQDIGQLTHAGPPPCTNAQVCLAERLTAGGVSYLSAAENVGHSGRTAAEAIEIWIASPSHNENLLGTEWTRVGIGFREGPSGATSMPGPWWTVVLAR